MSKVYAVLADHGDCDELLAIFSNRADAEDLAAGEQDGFVDEYELGKRRESAAYVPTRQEPVHLTGHAAMLASRYSEHAPGGITRPIGSDV